MNWIPRKRLASEPLIGTFLGIGSPISAEIASHLGFDWVLIDTEHGSGDFGVLVQQLQAVAAGGDSSPIVRVPWNDPVAIKQALDAGASGIMVPYVNTAEEARQAVSAVKYPPQGVRGTARNTRAANFGKDFDAYFSQANEHSLVVVQVETPEAVGNAPMIAAVDGVDVLFVGPLDLKVNLGGPRDFDPEVFDKSVDAVIHACQETGKTAGILALESEARHWIDRGMRLVAVGSDGFALVDGLGRFLQAGKR